MPWKPGESGNPSGRPKIDPQIVEMARAAGPKAIAALIDALKDPRLKVAAATALLERGFGKPIQTVNANVNILDGLNDDDRASTRAALQALIARSEEVARGDPSEGPLH